MAVYAPNTSDPPLATVASGTAPLRLGLWPNKSSLLNLTETIVLPGMDLDGGGQGEGGAGIQDDVTNMTCGFKANFKNQFGDVFDPAYIQYRFVTDVLIAGVLCAIGLVGNLVAFAVLRRIPGRSTPVVMRALALADIFYLITCVFFQVLKTLHLHTESFHNKFHSFAYIDVVVWPLASMAQTCSVWLVVLVTGDRCYGISQPLHAKSKATSQRAYIAIVIVVSLCMLFNTPTIFDLKFTTLNDTCTNETWLEAKAGPLTRNTTYQMVYKTVLCFIFRTAIPLILVLLLNSKILQAIRKSRKQSRANVHDDGFRAGASGLNKMVACVVCVFVVCEIPDLVYRALRALWFFAPRSIHLNWTYMTYFAHISNLMLTLNSSANFLIYFLMGRKFRQVLKHICYSRDPNHKAFSQVTQSDRTSVVSTKSHSLKVNHHIIS